MNTNEKGQLLTAEEKLDYIYITIKKQEKREFYKTIFKWIFRLFIVLYLLYFYFFGFSKILEIVTNSMKENLNIDINTQEMFDNLKEKMILNNNN